MPFLLQERHDFILGDAYRFIGNLVEQVGNTQFFTSGVEPFADFFL